jgi:hypothetical protein
MLGFNVFVIFLLVLFIFVVAAGIKIVCRARSASRTSG